MNKNKLLSFLLLLLLFSSCDYIKPEQKILREAHLGQNAPQGPLGVAECDDYIARYQKCIHEKIPEKSKQSYTQGLNDSINYWKTQSDTPEGKLGLKTACQVAYLGSLNTWEAFACEK